MGTYIGESGGNFNTKYDPAFSRKGGTKGLPQETAGLGSAIVGALNIPVIDTDGDGTPDTGLLTRLFQLMCDKEDNTARISKYVDTKVEGDDLPVPKEGESPAGEIAPTVDVKGA